MTAKNIVTFPTQITSEKLSGFLYVIRYFQSLSRGKYIEISCSDTYSPTGTFFLVSTYQWDEDEVSTEDDSTFIDDTVDEELTVTKRRFFLFNNEESKLDCADYEYIFETCDSPMADPDGVLMKHFLEVIQLLQSLSNLRSLKIRTYLTPDATKFNFIVEDTLIELAQKGWHGYANNADTEQWLSTNGRLFVKDDEDSISVSLFKEMLASITYHQRSFLAQDVKQKI